MNSNVVDAALALRAVRLTWELSRAADVREGRAVAHRMGACRAAGVIEGELEMLSVGDSSAQRLEAACDDADRHLVAWQPREGRP